MKIENNRKRDIQYFEHLKVGDAFEEAEEYYVKLNTFYIYDEVDEEYYQMNAVNLYTGKFTYIDAYSAVTKIDAKVVIM